MTRNSNWQWAKQSLVALRNDASCCPGQIRNLRSQCIFNQKGPLSKRPSSGGVMPPFVMRILLLTLVASAAVGLPCEKSGYCSVGKTRPYTGDIAGEVLACKHVYVSTLMLPSPTCECTYVAMLHPLLTLNVSCTHKPTPCPPRPITVCTYMNTRTHPHDNPSSLFPPRRHRRLASYTFSLLLQKGGYPADYHSQCPRQRPSADQHAR